MMFSHSSQVFTIKVLSWKKKASRDPNVIILVVTGLGEHPNAGAMVWCDAVFPFFLFLFSGFFFWGIVLHQVVVESPQVKRCAPQVEYVYEKCVKHRNIHWNHHLLHPVSSYYILLHERRCLRRRSPSLEAGISRSQAPWAGSFLAMTILTSSWKYQRISAHHDLLKML